jgi:hypothetical protein
LVRSVQTAVIARDRQQDRVHDAIGQLEAALPSDQTARQQALMVINAGRKSRGLPPLSALLESSPPQQADTTKMSALAITNSGRRARGEAALPATDFEQLGDRRTSQGVKDPDAVAKMVIAAGRKRRNESDD